jgi:hypothetical protein
VTKEGTLLIYLHFPDVLARGKLSKRLWKISRRQSNYLEPVEDDWLPDEGNIVKELTV